ncbi:MAG: hypothetical protein IT305_15285 [Chloroflexi bacterium]|nr:hypothetical protein [Chloroflexota bacterium]
MSETEPVDLSILEPGMDLCTFDFQKWGEFRQLRDADGAIYLEGVVDGSGVGVYVPVSAIVERHGQCIRLAQPRATIDVAGWDRRPAGLTD